MKDVILYGIAMLGFWVFLCPLLESKTIKTILVGVIGGILGYAFGSALVGVM